MKNEISHSLTIKHLIIHLLFCIARVFLRDIFDIDITVDI